MKKWKLSYHVNMILLLGFSVLVIGMIMFFTSYYSNQQKQVVIDNYIYQQQESVNRVIRHLKEATENQKTKDTETLFSEYLQEEKNTVEDYWFIYTEDAVVFERDSMQSALVEGKKLAELKNDWINHGGFSEIQAQELFQGELASAVFAKDAQGERAVVSVRAIESKEVTYFVGNASKETFILQLSDYHENRNLFYLFMVAMGLSIIFLSIQLGSKLKKVHLYAKQLQEITREHNSQITRLDQELKERRKQVKNYQLLDPLSLFYNREYFYTLLLNMTRQDLKSIGMIIVEIASLHDLIKQHGLEYEQEALGAIACCIDSSIREESVIARVESNQIAITLLNDNYREMSEDCATLEKNLKELNYPFKITVFSVIQMQQESAIDMYQRMNRIVRGG